MNLAELGERIDAATDVFRVETLDAYASVNDGGNFARYLAGEPGPDRTKKQWYLDGLRWRAENGHPQRRLRVIPRPVSDYVRYACEWGYTDNVAAGEDVRVIDEAAGQDEMLPGLWVGSLRKRFGDFYVLDGEVIVMRYTGEGAFLRAESYGHDAEDYTGTAEAGWRFAVPFTQWWAAHPELHRDLATC